MNNAQEIAKIIRLETSNKNILISKMLNDIGLGRNSMANLDNGSMLRADSLGKIADYLDVSVDYLLGREETPSANNPQIENSTTEKHYDETTLQVATVFQQLDFIGKAKVMSLLAELTDKNKTA